MLLELVQQCLRSVVEEVDGSIVQRGEDPGPELVERESLHALGLRLEFLQHL